MKLVPPIGLFIVTTTFLIQSVIASRCLDDCDKANDCDMRESDQGTTNFFQPFSIVSVVMSIVYLGYEVSRLKS